MSHLPKNLAPLKEHSPALAAHLASAPIPEGFLPTQGADNTPTFCRIAIEGTQKRRHWLGSTSLPAATAHALIASLDLLSNGANGLALSAGTAFQWRAATEKLSRPQMLYLYEPDAGQLRMALEICDLADLLATKRLVLLAGTPDQAAQALATFLTQNLGCEPPTVLHPPANLTGERRTTLLAAGEHIVRHALQSRADAETAAHQRLADALAHSEPRTQNSELPNTLALLLTPRHSFERPIQSAAQHCKQILIDHHNSASALLRLTALADVLEAAARENAAGPVRILSDLFSPQLNLPPEVPVETWVPPLVGTAWWDRLPTTIRTHDRIVVHFTHHENLLRARGIPASQITRQPLSEISNLKSQIASLENQKSKIENPVRVALIADLPACDPASLGIELPTHQAVYAAAREMIEEDYLAIHPGMAADLLRRALTRAGVDPKTEDPALKDPMLRLITGALIPAIPLLTLAKNLARENIPLTLLGDWPGLGGGDLPANADVRTIPFENFQQSDWLDIALLAHHSPDGTFSPLLLQAILLHIPITTCQHPMTADIDQLLPPDSSRAHAPARQYLSTLKSLLRDTAQRKKIATAAIHHLTT